jgi:hypothetical protein
MEKLEKYLLVFKISQNNNKKYYIKNYKMNLVKKICQIKAQKIFFLL